jgi:hypothetical protein
MVSPPRLRVPLQSYRVSGINDTLIRAILTLSVRSAQNEFNEVPFQFDSATPICSMPVIRAARLGVVMPHKVGELSVKTAAGEKRQMRRQGRIRVKVPGLGNEMYDWPCHFVEGAQLLDMPLLGLVGVLDNLRISLEGTYSLEAPYGWLIVERLR